MLIIQVDTSILGLYNTGMNRISPETHEAAKFVNGLFPHTVDYQPLHFEELKKRIDFSASESSDVKTFGKLTMAAGTLIAGGSIALEVVGTSERVMNLGVGMGLGSVAVGAVIYGFDQISSRK